MQKFDLNPLTEIEGFLGACLVDSDSGMTLGHIGGGVDLETAAAGNTEVVRAKRKTMKALKLDDHIEDILITLSNQYHIIRPLETNDAIFLYVVLSRKANLAFSRQSAKNFEKTLDMTALAQ